MSAQLDGHLFGPDQPCFGCGPLHSSGFRLRFTRNGEQVVTNITPSDQYQGPPGIMHGGLVMTLADEVAAWTVLTIREKFGFTASFEGRLKRPVRVGVATEARGWIVKDGHRMVRVGVSISQKDEPCFEGEVLFALVDEAGAEKLLGTPIPETWRRFCR